MVKEKDETYLLFKSIIPEIQSHIYINQLGRNNRTHLRLLVWIESSLMLGRYNIDNCIYFNGKVRPFI